jgi:hypothetical protein
MPAIVTQPLSLFSPRSSGNSPEFNILYFLANYSAMVDTMVKCGSPAQKKLDLFRDIPDSTMLAKFLKSPLLNPNKRVLTRTFIATPVAKYENDRPSFNAYVLVSLGYHPIPELILCVSYTFDCTDGQNTSVLAPAITNPTWENVVLIKPEATTTSVMSVTNVEAVGITFTCRVRTDTTSR